MPFGLRRMTRERKVNWICSWDKFAMRFRLFLVFCVVPILCSATGSTKSRQIARPCEARRAINWLAEESERKKNDFSEANLKTQCFQYMKKARHLIPDMHQQIEPELNQKPIDVHSTHCLVYNYVLYICIGLREIPPDSLHKHMVQMTNKCSCSSTPALTNYRILPAGKKGFNGGFLKYAFILKLFFRINVYGRWIVGVWVGGRAVQIVQ